MLVMALVGGLLLGLHSRANQAKEGHGGDSQGDQQGSSVHHLPPLVRHVLGPPRAGRLLLDDPSTAAHFLR